MKYNEKNKTVWIDKDSHKKLQFLSVRMEKPLSYLVNIAVKELIEKYKRFLP